MLQMLARQIFLSVMGLAPAQPNAGTRWAQSPTLSLARNYHDRSVELRHTSENTSG
jgi:hypothetical protein